MSSDSEHPEPSGPSGPLFSGGQPTEHSAPSAGPSEPPNTVFNPLTGDTVLPPKAEPLARPEPWGEGVELASRLDRWAEWLGDHLNPLLVKEVRQALKSRWFATMFGLLLCFAWGASLIGLAAMGPDVAWEARGPNMFYVYYLALAFALLVVVPYGAFRSLAVEQEDHTYELLAITALGPRQIVAGKLASAVMQMLIYLSVLMPCLAFTYLLRGIDLPTIAIVIVWTAGGSLVLSAAGLLLGSVSLQRVPQAVVSVGAVVGLFIVFGYACVMAEMMLPGGWWEPAGPDLWIFTLAAATIGASYFALFLLAAAAQVSFASENRSTPLRVVVFVQFLLWTGWFGWLWISQERAGDVLFVYAAVAGANWYATGIFFAAESPRLSLRVRRRLPQSFLGRVLFTWFNPGPGTGLMFSVGGALTVWLLTELAARWSSTWIPDTLRMFCAAGVAYLAIYLGAEVLILRLLRRFVAVGVNTGLVVHLLLVLFGAALPSILSLVLYPTVDYGPLHFLNYFYTLPMIAVDSRRLLAAPLVEFLAGAAAVVLGLNLPGVVREIAQVRIAAPARVVEEEQAGRPELPVHSARESPWD